MISTSSIMDVEMLSFRYTSDPDADAFGLAMQLSSKQHTSFQEVSIEVGFGKRQTCFVIFLHKIALLLFVAMAHYFTCSKTLCRGYPRSNNSQMMASYDYGIRH
jgi:hypothetical protein